MNLVLALQHRAVAAIQHWFGASTSRSVQGSQYLPPRSQQHTRAPRMCQPHTAAPAAVLHSPVASSRTTMPLRVLRVVESGQGHASTGRMVISGRMADVCAELDRLVAREDASFHF